ncbi:MAG: hypothetical protein TREMPRED_003114 [Tremellales sp. Tagirdzhanova-0007]|nr:MAG: hypothetical protein TREMPRED_003114 [Tremellales sp. Tagirdzhanova-0007]
MSSESSKRIHSTMSIPQVQLAGKTVGQMGFGLMQLTWNPSPPPEEQSLAAMKTAADAGATAWSTAGFYGNPGDGQSNLKLIRKFFDKYPQYRDKIVLVVKGTMDEKIHVRADDIEWCRNELKVIREILGPEKDIDVYSPSRLPPNCSDATKVQIFKNMATLQKEGLFKAVGASELSAATLEMVSKVVPIAVVEIEVSLWSYEQEIQDVIKWSKQHQVPVFCYSPLGRGFLSRKWSRPEDIPDGNFQKYLPRFQGEAFYENLKLVDSLDQLSKEKGMKTTQMALAWVTNLSPYQNIPIPGSSNSERILENVESSKVKFSKEDHESIDKVLSSFSFNGGRYMDAMNGLQMQ